MSERAEPSPSTERPWERGVLEPATELTAQQIEQACEAAFANAVDLLDEAEILRANARCSRAYFLAHIACEELGKLPILTTAAVAQHLCLGGMNLLMTLNCRALERRFARANISARVAQGEQAGRRFLQCERSGRAIDVPAPAREQVLIEGLTLDCLVEIMAWMLDGGPPPGRQRQSAVRP